MQIFAVRVIGCPVGGATGLLYHSHAEHGNDKIQSEPFLDEPELLFGASELLALLELESDLASDLPEELSPEEGALSASADFL
jgi:hypothetical protein